MRGRKEHFARRVSILSSVLLTIASGEARGQGHHGHGSLSSSRYGHPGPQPAGPVLMPRRGGPWPGGVPYYGGSPFLVGLGGIFLPVIYTPVPVQVPPAPVGGGLMLPAPRMQPMVAAPAPAAKVRTDPSKAEGYVKIGDNLFRAGNTHRAEQRYLQAVRANPSWAAPRVRLTQLALVRGDYQDAAEQLRAAMAAEPGWLVNAIDVQALFAEPGDFAKALARLESHLQASPTDRDGWLVLGAEWYLSGRTRQAADIFTRLNDRKPDATLSAFLDATTPDAIARDVK